MKNCTIVIIVSIFASSPLHSATHVVKAGENMYRIAIQYKVSLAELQSANPKARVEALHVGQNLVIPRSAKVAVVSSPARISKTTVTATSSHQVVAGETLGSIARNCGISVADLQALNPSINPATLRIGQTISVGGRPVAKPVITQIASDAPRTQPKPDYHGHVKQKSMPKAVVQSETTIAATRTISTDSSKRPAPVPVTEAMNVVAPSSISEESDVPHVASQVAKTPKGNVPSPANASPKDSSAEKIQEPVKMIKTTREMTLADFAIEYGTTTDHLNDINGWNFPPHTLFAVDSEMNVPAQP
jgi:LysM repeat protein